MTAGFEKRVREKLIRLRKKEEAILFLAPPAADLRVTYGPDPSQFGDLRLPAGEGKHPVIVVIHGGFWRAQYGLEHTGRLCAAITARGYATWCIEYRRLGNPGGGFPGTFLDVARAIDYLRELAPKHSLDLTRVGTLGHSAGGHLALWAAARHRIRKASPLYTDDPLIICAAISLAGVCDLRRASALGLSGGVTEELVGGAPAQVPGRYAVASPIELIPINRREFLLHGTEDSVVPLEISERFYDAARARGEDVTLIQFPQTGHFELIDPESSAWPQVLETIKRAV